MNDIDSIIARQNILCGNVPKCTACGTVQVQLVQSAVPAVWKCRYCKHMFEFEPS